MENEVLDSLLAQIQVDEDVTVRKVEDNYVELTNGNVFAIFNDAGRKKAAQQACLETFTFFHPSFLASATGLPAFIFENLDENVDEAEIEKLLSAVNTSIEEFTEKAVSEDGYGHLISPYDGDEIELPEGLYAYRLD